jgi:alpha-ketoglutaric semialdehyde dehydrogenase
VIEPTGQHLIDGDWVSSDAKFTSIPLTGPGVEVNEGTAAEVDRAAKAAEACFASVSAMPVERHAALLRRIAAHIDDQGDAITAYGVAETGLPNARLVGERGRTVGQLRLFADYIESGDHLDQRHDPAQPDRSPVPAPDLRLVQRPIGPVAVFGASNFPLAFSTAGGDTASALAAGCPVIVKGHPAHPATGEIVARAIASAVSDEGYPAAMFQLVQGSTHDLGRALVEHPLISAVGFTGSLGAGRALFDLCTRRPVPIPFFGELGSINPVFVLPHALAARGAEIAKAWAASLTMGAGQFCTNPGLIVLPKGPEGDAFLDVAVAALQEVAAQPMLTTGIADDFINKTQQIAKMSTLAFQGQTKDRDVAPFISCVSASEFSANPALRHEVFGPFGLVVRSPDPESTLSLAKELDGQLTCSLQVDEGDAPEARQLLAILERKAGRILSNGFPTGVEVASAMVHGGPYPASTNFGHTSVGTMAIRRWMRPISYQDLPDYLVA